MIEGPEPDETFAKFWAPIVCPNGVWDHDAVKAELHDYAMLLESVPEVYCHITGGRISKPNTIASAVIAEHDDTCRNGLDPDAVGAVLTTLVETISETRWAAGWMSGIEYDLWDEYQNGTSNEDVQRMGDLAESVKLWPCRDGCVPFDEMWSRSSAYRESQ